MRTVVIWSHVRTNDKRNPLRLVITVERYAPAIGGAERVVQRVAEGLAARGHVVHVMTGGEQEDVELGGVQVHRLPVSGNQVRGVRGDASLVTSLMGRIEPDLVFNYAAQTWATDCCFGILEHEDRPRMVMAPCGFSGLDKARYASYFATMPAVLRSYDALIFPSEAYQDWGFAHRSGVERIFLVANGADPATATGKTLRAHIPSGQIVLTVGSHVLSKGHGDFARATRTLARHRELTGVIVAAPRRGLDALRGCHLACHARARVGSHLKVVDGSPAGVVADALAAADLFMFTSKIESGPLVILEAMATGTPWVSLDVGHASQLAGGIVVSELSEVVEVAKQILDGHHPQLGAEGREAWNANHRWESIVARYESVFETLLA
jgi:glycosyltransferase involved in cell wall biosynthesis